MKFRTQRSKLPKVALVALPLFALLATDTALAQSTDSIRLEVEDFTHFFDSTPGNSGNAYRTDPGEDVDIEATQDVSGEFNVGWFAPGEFMEYTMLFESGTYAISTRVGSESAGGSIDVKLNGNVVATDNFGSTGGWQNWQTHNIGVMNVDNYGAQTIGVHINHGEFNLNWLNFEKVAGDIRVEAEDYNNFSDSDSSNNGGVYRNDAVDIEASSDVDGGFNVGWTQPGEFLEYNVALAEGSYDLIARVASQVNTGSYRLVLDGTVIGSNTVSTGDWQNWTSQNVGSVTVSGGMHNLRIEVTGPDFNINWVTFVEQAPLDSDGDAISDNVDECPNTPIGTLTNSLGCPVIAGATLHIEAENYDASFDDGAGNDGSRYRDDNVDLEETQDTGNGFNIGWMRPGESLDYNIAVHAGTYEVLIRVASEFGGGSYSISVNGSTLNDTVSATGDWQNWETRSLGNITLSEGHHTLSLNMLSEGMNLNWIELKPVTGPPTIPHDTVTEKELMMTDLSVVESPEAANGVWSFEHLIASMMPQANPTLAQKSAFVLNWLRTWNTDQTVNGFVVDARSRMDTQVINPWIASSPDETALDFSAAPFRLLAIVNRMDLNSIDSNGNVTSAGEGRFVFGVTSAAGFPMSFTVIIEYGLPASSQAELDTWANRWHALGEMDFGVNYNAALAAITEDFAGKNADLSKPNGSSLNQLRTNEIALAGPWELREFLIDPISGNLNQEIVALTPDMSFDNTQDLADFINTNETDILNGIIDLPIDMRAGSSLTPFGFFWQAPNVNNNDARHTVSLNTCSGCHAGETGTSFLHVANRSVGSTASLSGFLTGTSISDPVDSTVTRQFGDLDARRLNLNCLADGNDC